MFINSEKELEDYICENQEDFIKELKRIYDIDKEIKFLGRQVRIGNDNIADLIFYYEDMIDEQYNLKGINYIIVELKFRKLEPRDLSQISRYMTILDDKLSSEPEGYEYKINGLFVSTGENDDLQELIINFNCLENFNIKFLEIESRLTYRENCWTHKEEYISEIKLDERIKNINKGE